MKPKTPRRPKTRNEVARYRDYEVHTIGAERPGFHDLYHFLLTVPWWGALTVIGGGYLALNALFAIGYLQVGGVVNAEPGSFLDAFFFSVQTMGTIGYGVMAPVTRGANALVVLESLTGLVVTALATGLVFVRFSRVRTKVRFSSRVAVAPVDGVPTLMIRVGNERKAQIVDASFRLNLTRTLTTKEGMTLYRAEQLTLVHDKAPLLTRSLMMRHVIDASSPLSKDTPASIAESELELTASLTATDETSLQPVHARATWSAREIVYGARLADVMSEPEPDKLVLDLRRFHELVPTDATDAFPYSADAESLAAPPTTD